MADIRTLDGALSAKNASPNESVVKALEFYLEEARSGKLQTFGLIGVSFDGFITRILVGTGDMEVMLGSIERLKHDILAGKYA